MSQDKQTGFSPTPTPRARDFLNNLNSNAFGGKDIAYFSGIVLLINNITGPGVPGLPNMFAEAGWLIPTLVLFAVYGMTTLSSTMYAEAMANIPGNEVFQDRIEYSTIVKYYFGRNWYIAAQVGLNGALQSLNIISVIQSAQIMDNALAAVFGKSCGLNVSPFQNTWTNSNGTGIPLDGSTDVFSCFDTSDVSNGNAWGCHVILSLGFIVTAAMAIPCGYWNLDDNMVIQRVAFWLTVLCWAIWMIATFAAYDSATAQALPAINNNPDTGSIAGVVGTILFNFGFVTTVPSWINEKKPEVSVNKSLWSATTICVIIYIAIGIPGAVVFSDVLQGPVTAACPANVRDPSFNCPNDLMQTLTQKGDGSMAPWQSSSAATFLLQSSVYMFPIVAVVSSIPVFSIVIKYNLVENGFSNQAGLLWGVVFPWVAALPLLYMPNLLAQFVNFTSLLFVSFTDFIVPFSLYVILQRRQSESTRHPNVAFSKSNADSEKAANLLDHMVGGEHQNDVEGGDPDVLPHEVKGALPELDFDFSAEPHTALPAGCGRDSPHVKTNLSIGLGFLLTVLSCVGIYLTIAQGTYLFDAQTCALVGN